MKAAADAGILMVAAAGNSAGKGILYPAAYPEVIAVGATTSDGTVLSGSATGNELELLAPGSQIISTGMVDGYTAGSGTSLATAEVTGIASLLLSQPGATADVVRGLLGATAKEVAGSNAGLVDYGYAKEHFAEYLAAYQNNEVDETVFDNPTVPETYDTEGIVNGLWAAEKHAWLVEKADESLSLNSTYVTIMSYSAKRADESAYHNTSLYPQYNGLHGLGVYTVNLYAIWKFANYTNKGEPAQDASDLTIQSFSKEQKEKIKGEKNYPPEGVLTACGKLLEKDTDAKNKGYTSSNAKKKYLVAGFACHMIGDIYAHRTIVPDYVYNVSDKGNEELIPSTSSSSFDARLGKNDFTRWDDLITAHNNGTIITFPHLVDYTSKTSRFNALYEDNVNFCRERFRATLDCTKEFLRRISSSSENTPNGQIIKQDLDNHVRLINYNKYI